MFLGRTCSRSSIRRASALRTGWRPSWSSWRTSRLCFSTGICSLLDRMAILASCGTCAQASSWTRTPGAWSSSCRTDAPGLVQHLPGSARGERPASLLCPTFYPPNCAIWGFRHLKPLMRESPYIHKGPLSWIDNEHLDQCREHSSGPPVLFRIGEAALEFVSFAYA